MNDSSSTDSVTAVSDTTLDAHVINTIFNTSDRLTPLELKRRVQHACRPVKHGQIESSIKRLVEQKELIYTYQFGNSFLEPSFEKPVRVANSIILKPPNAKYHPLPDDIVVNNELMLDDAEIGIFAYGSVARTAQAAVRMCREEGIKVGLLEPTTLWPFPEKAVLEMARKVKAIVVPELNLGQMAREVKLASECRVPVHKLGRVDGSPIPPQQLVEKIREVV